MTKEWKELELEHLRNNLKLQGIELKLKDKELADSKKSLWSTPTITLSIAGLIFGFIGGQQKSSFDESNLKTEIIGLKSHRAALTEKIGEKAFELSGLITKIESKNQSLLAVKNSVTKGNTELEVILGKIKDNKKIESSYQTKIESLKIDLDDQRAKIPDASPASKSINKAT